MKKLSLLLSAFALVAGLSQCRKPNMPVLNAGETQYVVLNASWDNGGSKLEQVGAGLKWKEGDKLYVNQGDESIGTLICKDPDNGIFEGYINETTGNITFTFHGANYKEDFKEQTGKLNDAVLLKSEELEYRSDGDYGTVLMKMPHAVLKLDLSALGTEGGTKVTIKIKTEETVVASVEGVKNDEASKALYVAVKVDETPAGKTYKFSGNGKVASRTGWELKANTFYTKNAEGVSTGDAIVITPPVFSVSSTTKVEFSPGNLWYGTEDGAKPEVKAFYFEANQWSTTPASDGAWDANHVNHFLWSNTIDWQTKNKEPYAANYSFSISEISDVFFTETSDFQVYGEADGTWRTLTKDEWSYLLGTASPNRANASSLRAWKDLGSGIKGLVILPDGTENPSGVLDNITSTDALDNYDAVFLPATGYRISTSVGVVGSHGYYWSSTPGASGFAGRMYFNSDEVRTNFDNRNCGIAVRLVRLAQ
ncbi:MAG: hypothetical protein MJZ78_05890 [Bacteroidales bacterium]|nr:hypothetical protein [Bacteroidales bacterium]